MNKEPGINSQEANPAADQWKSLILESDKTRKESYLNSDLGGQETSVEDVFNQGVKEYDEMVASGRMTAKEAEEAKKQWLQSADDAITDVRNEYVASVEQSKQSQPEQQPKQPKAEEGKRTELSQQLVNVLRKAAEQKSDEVAASKKEVSYDTDEHHNSRESRRERGIDNLLYSYGDWARKQHEAGKMTDEEYAKAQEDALNSAIAHTEHDYRNGSSEEPAERTAFGQQLTSVLKQVADQKANTEDAPTQTDSAPVAAQQAPEAQPPQASETAPATTPKIETQPAPAAPEAQPASEPQPDSRTLEVARAARQKLVDNRIFQIESWLDSGRITQAKADKMIADLKATLENIPEDTTQSTQETDPKKDKLTSEQSKKLKDERDALLKELAKHRQEMKDIETSIKVGREAEVVDKKIQEIDDAAKQKGIEQERIQLAHEYAEKELDQDNAKSNFIKRIWKGKIRRKHYLKKYKNDIIEGDRNITIDNKEMSFEEAVTLNQNKAIQAYVAKITKEYGKYSDALPTEDSASIKKANPHATQFMEGLVQDFAVRKIPKNGSIEDLRKDFNQQIDTFHQVFGGQKIGQKIIDNYFDVAMQARACAEHNIALDRVMEGFDNYNTETRNNITSEKHREYLDEVIRYFEGHPNDSALPKEVLSSVAKSALTLTQAALAFDQAKNKKQNNNTGRKAA